MVTALEVGLFIVTEYVKLWPLVLFCVLVGVPLVVSVEGEITRRMPVEDDFDPGDVWNVVCT